MRPQHTILYLDHVGVLGGAELNLVDMARHAGRRGHVVLMADGPLKGILEAVGTTVTLLTAPARITNVRRSSGLLRSARTVPLVMRMAWKIAKLARNYDVIWANSQKSFVIGSFAAAISRRPLVWHMHDILTAEHFSADNRRVAVGLANRFATRVVTVSEAGHQSFVDAGGRPDLAVVVHNGIDAADYPPTTPADRSAARRSLGLPPDAPVVGVFGRITPWKGQHVLLEAMQSLPGVHAVLVGEPLFNEDEYADLLKGMTARMGLTDRVHFAGFRKDIPAAMAACDVIAHTSTSPEPFGRVIVEAMLARRPVVATAAGGAAEIITDGVDGRLIPPADPKALASAIGSLLADTAAAASLADAGYRTASTRFTLDQFLAAVDDVVDEVVAEQTGREEPVPSRRSVEVA